MKLSILAPQNKTSDSFYEARSPMKPQLLLAEGNKRMNSSIAIFQTKMLRDSKSMGIFLLFAISVLKAHFIVYSF